ncbi:MAG TPA: polysaccharide biosynthesis tyrosine autokinase [Propionibacteriaceae bacterium]|nr:polysaccharide biosynthesis tyrosine autokinase [Propionibacteriaceae bacterium]
MTADVPAVQPVSEPPADRRPNARGALDLRSHLDALRRYWRTVLLCTVLGVLVAGAITLTMQRQYETRITFFVVASTGTGVSPLQADEFAQRRINSYVGIVRSEYMAAEVVDDTGLDIPPDEVQKMISTSVDPETVLMNVTVTDTSPERSLVIGTSIAERLDATIDDLESRPSRNAIRLSVVSGPTLNPDPVSPREKLNLALGLLLGLGVGIAQALLRYQLDTSFRSRDQIVAAGIPYLGTLYKDPALKNVSVLNPAVRRPLLAETIRQLRTNLRFVPTAAPVKVLAVASSVDGEGRSTTAVELASSFAELGRRALLIDADLRRPGLGRLLGISGSAGLSGVLIGDAKLEDAVQVWGQHELRVLPGGLVPPNPSELLASAAMTELLTAARSSYDVVVLDTAALLPVADGAVAASHADGVLLLIRHGETAADDALRSVETLRAVNAPLLGAVLSLAPAGRSERRAARSGKGRPPAVLVDALPSSATVTPPLATPNVKAEGTTPPDPGPAPPPITAAAPKPTAAAKPPPTVLDEDAPTVIAKSPASGPVESVPPKAPAEQ